VIRNVVFDVGGVLVRLRYQGFIDYMSGAGVDMSDLPAWLARIDLEAHERGEVSGAQMIERMAGMARRPIDPRELERRWLDLFERADDMFELARRLMDQHRVYLLSNAGDLHWRFLDEQYGLERLTHGAIASFQVGTAKPSASIYREAERRFALEPQATVFVDDLAPNVRGAQACGWHAIRHRSATDTRQRLRELGVQVPESSRER
jgi:HAD superfamily hydrolase (TIGR01509 family)